MAVIIVNTAPRAAYLLAIVCVCVCAWWSFEVNGCCSSFRRGHVQLSNRQQGRGVCLHEQHNWHALHVPRRGPVVNESVSVCVCLRAIASTCVSPRACC